jgi:hypothetical protein
MLIERLRLQQGTIEGVGHQRDMVRAQLADLRNAKPQTEQQIKETEELLERTTDPNGRLDMETRIKSMKARLARLRPKRIACAIVKSLSRVSCITYRRN